MGTISLWLRSPAGLLLMPGLPATSVEWTLGENAFHVLKASGPLNLVDPTFFQQDARLEVMRSIDGATPYLEGRTQFFLRYWAFGEKAGQETWKLEAYSAEYLASGRFVDYDASTETVTNAYSTKTAAADDMIKAILRENGGASSTLAARICAELSIDADLGQGVSLTRSFARRVLLDLFNEIAEESYQQGTYISWGMTADNTGTGTGFTFHTWTTQRGQDHTRGTQNEVVVSKALGNLAEPCVFFDHRSEYTAVRAGGTGTGADRMTSRQEDTVRSAASAVAYREEWLDARSAETQAALDAEARSELEASRPRNGFSGILLDTDYARYGVRFGLGDLVTAEYMGRSFTCRVTPVKGKWSKDKGEQLTIKLEEVHV